MLEEIKRQFALTEQDIRTYSPLTLAYIGDGVYEVVVRTVAVEQANRPTHELHKWCTTYVKAPAQAQMLLGLQDMLTQEEADVVRRGRNAKPYTTAKNASRADYHKATGFEAVCGWLSLKGDTERLQWLMESAVAYLEQDN